MKELLPVQTLWEMGFLVSVLWISGIDWTSLLFRTTNLIEDKWSTSLALRGIKLLITELSLLLCVFLKLFSIESYLSFPSVFCVLSFWKSSTQVNALSFYMCKELREGRTVQEQCRMCGGEGGLFDGAEK